MAPGLEERGQFLCRDRLSGVHAAFDSARFGGVGCQWFDAERVAGGGSERIVPLTPRVGELVSSREWHLPCWYRLGVGRIPGDAAAGSLSGSS